MEEKREWFLANSISIREMKRFELVHVQSEKCIINGLLCEVFEFELFDSKFKDTIFSRKTTGDNENVDDYVQISLRSELDKEVDKVFASFYQAFTKDLNESLHIFLP